MNKNSKKVFRHCCDGSCMDFCLACCL